MKNNDKYTFGINFHFILSHYKKNVYLRLWSRYDVIEVFVLIVALCVLNLILLERSSKIHMI